jgi:amidohydrolase
MSIDEGQPPGQIDGMDTSELADLTELRRDLHRHPEQRFAEHRTSSLLADRLRGSGFDVRTGFARTAVFGTLDSGRLGPHVMLRADMDALPTADLKDAPYASTNAGVCHACGHDVHCAVVLGAARLLGAQDRLAEGGRLSVLYQPAEEIPFGESSGAQAVLDSGVLDEQDDITAVLGLHCWPQLPAGTVGVDPAVAMAAKLAFQITISGKGARGYATSRA